MAYYIGVSGRWSVAGFVARCLDTVRAMLARGRYSQQSHGADENPEVLRLAETSPHLLADIGLRQESDGAWTNGRSRVRVPRASAADLLLRSGRL